MMQYLCGCCLTTEESIHCTEYYEAIGTNGNIIQEMNVNMLWMMQSTCAFFYINN